MSDRFVTVQNVYNSSKSEGKNTCLYTGGNYQSDYHILSIVKVLISSILVIVSSRTKYWCTFDFSTLIRKL